MPRLLFFSLDAYPDKLERRNFKILNLFKKFNEKNRNLADF
jgi:hypothetical protein